jgi:curli biogenesis system outer membrane secretion channel CsgG
MRVPVTRPAEIYLKEPRKVLITEFKGNGGEVMAAALTRQLVETGKFEVFDRTILEQKLRESNPNLQPTATQAVTGALLDRLYRGGKNRLLGREGMENVLRDVDPKLVGPDSQAIAAEMAKLVGGGYLLSGDITAFSYTKQDSKEPRTRDAKGKAHMTFIKLGTASASATVQIVNLSTGMIVASKNISKKVQRTTRAQDTLPPDPDKNEMLNEAVDEGVADFVRQITPHIDYVTVSFAKNGLKLPEMNRGVEFARSGLWPEAAEQFRVAVKQNPGYQGAWWNLGLAYEYSFRFEEAEAAFKEAMKIGRCDKCNWEIHNVRTLAEDRKQLQEQGVQ